MWTKMSNAVFTWLLSLHYEMETLWGREGMNVSHSGNNVPSLLWKHFLYIIVIDMLFVYFTCISMIAYLVCFYVFILYEM